MNQLQNVTKVFSKCSVRRTKQGSTHLRLSLWTSLSPQWAGCTSPFPPYTAPLAHLASWFDYPSLEQTLGHLPTLKWWKCMCVIYAQDRTQLWIMNTFIISTFTIQDEGNLWNENRAKGKRTTKDETYTAEFTYDLAQNSKRNGKTRQDDKTWQSKETKQKSRKNHRQMKECTKIITSTSGFT